MPNDHFSRLLRLAQKTGDRLIVTDVNGGEPVVILPLDEYESLIDNALGLSEPYGIQEEAEFDTEEIEQGILKDLWQEPVTEVAPLEVIERPEPETPYAPPSHEPEPVPEPVVQPQVRRPVPQRPPVARPANKEDGEEQFYLEPV